MLNRRQWLLFIVLPMLLVIAVDQCTKTIAESTLSFSPLYSSVFQWRLYHNYGFMLSSMDSDSKLYTVVLPSAFGVFFFYLTTLIQYFFPLISILFRCGLAIITGGVLSNIIDRIRLGYVVDFVAIVTPDFSTGIFNVADALQWVGLALLVIGYAKAGRLLYPKNERRKRIWIDSNFQGKFCAGLIFIGASFAALSGLFSQTFLKEALSSMGTTNGVLNENALQLISSFTSLYSATALMFLCTLLGVGVLYSHRIVGPIRGFEVFMNDIMQGKNRSFKVRTHDEFSHLENLADRFQQFFNEKLAINPLPLEVGQPMPSISGITYDNKTIDMEYFKGRKAWVMLYRYATCPLCMVNLDDNSSLIDRAIEQDIAVTAVFESSPEQFLKSNTGETSCFLKQNKIPLIADPDRNIYRALRGQVLSHRGFRLATLKTLWKARKRGFTQRSIDGKFGQLPTHLFIDEKGKVVIAHYGENFTDHPKQELIRSFVENSNTAPTHVNAS